jgi:hypothetical protein
MNTKNSNKSKTIIETPSLKTIEGVFEGNKFLKGFPDTCFTFKLKNDSYNTEKIELFSMNNLDLPKHLSIKCYEYENLHDLLIQIKGLKTGSWMNGMRLISDSVFPSWEQFANSIIVKISDINESAHLYPLKPLAYRTAYHQIKEQVDIPEFKCFLDKRVTMEIILLPKTTLTIVMQYHSIEQMIRSGTITHKQYEEWLEKVYPTINI